jgi:hypothetical protein
MVWKLHLKQEVQVFQTKPKTIVLGGSPANGVHSDQLFKGSLDDLKIFNKALSASESFNNL